MVGQPLEKYMYIYKSISFDTVSTWNSILKPQSHLG